MRSILCSVVAAGAMLFIGSNARAMPPIASALSTAVDQQIIPQEVRCRGHRCGQYHVSRPRSHASRPQARSYGRPSNAWEHNPLNTQPTWEMKN
jgi:hypothetical protein